MKRIICIYSEIPKGLTSCLRQFLDPFASAQTLRNRLRDDAHGPEKTEGGAAVPPPAPLPPAPAVAPAAPAAPAAATAPTLVRYLCDLGSVTRLTHSLQPAPSPEEIQRGLQTLRAAVQARCAVLGASASAAPPAEGDEFEAASLFKWDRACEEALYAVVSASQRVGGGCVPCQPSV